MWSDWKQKIKEFADDITSPQFEEEDEEAEDGERERHRPSHDAASSPPRTEPTAGASPALSRAPAEADCVTQDDPSRRLEYTVERGGGGAASRPVATAAKTAPTSHDPSTTASLSPAGSVTPALVTSGASTAATNAEVSSATAVIASLEKRVAELRDEKNEMGTRIAAYQEEVRATHEQTVAYYEARQAQREAELLATASKEKQDLATELDAVRRRADEAEAALQTSAQRVAALEQALAEQGAQLQAALANRTSTATSPSQELQVPPVATEAQPPSVDAVAFQRMQEENTRLARDLEEAQRQLVALTQNASRTHDESAVTELEAKAAALHDELTAERARRLEVEQQCADQARTFEQLKDDLALERQEAVSAVEQRVASLQAQLDAPAASDASAATQLATLEQQVRSAEQRATAAEQALEHLREESGAFQQTAAQNLELQRAALTKEWEARLAVTQSEQQTLQQRLDAAQRELGALNHDRDEERARLTVADNASVAELREMNQKLLADVQHHQTLLEQLEATVVEALTHAEVELPSRGRSGGYSFSDLVAVLTSEFGRLVTEQDKSSAILQEWEDTYEKAKEVNESLNEQLAEAWRTVGVVQEELSATKREHQQTRAQLQQSEQSFRACEGELMEERRLRQELSDEKSTWVRRVNESETGVAGQQAMVQALQREVQSSHALIAAREEELATARRSVENLQLALETFKQNRSRDVHERTVDLQAEVDELRAQLARAEKSGTIGGNPDMPGGRDGGVDGRQRDQLVRELAAKNVEVTHLHGKLQELRRMLEDTARQLSGETMIDKGVVSHLMVNYIHATVSQRKEADEMLKVMSGLLSWDDEMQERAGLLPGPLNPHPPENKGRRGFLSFGRRGPTAPTVAASAAANGTAAKGTKKPSLAALWVDFLMKESTANDTSRQERSPAHATSEETAPSPQQTVNEAASDPADTHPPVSPAS